MSNSSCFLVFVSVASWIVVRDKSRTIHEVTRKRNPLDTNLVAGGKFDQELCARVSVGVFDPDATAMRFDNAAGNCQSHSAPGLVVTNIAIAHGAKELVKNTLPR